MKTKKLIIAYFSFVLLFVSACTHDIIEPIPPPPPSPKVIDIGWEAFKFPNNEDSERVGVSGTFSDYTYELANESPDIMERLLGGEITIETNSVKVGNSRTKTDNVLNYFFDFFTTTIEGEVKAINENNAIITITMNNVPQDIEFTVVHYPKVHSIAFSGTIEDLYKFNAHAAYDKLDENCGSFHKGKVWPDIALEIKIDNYDDL